MVLLTELGRFAVFDGAGQHFASDIAAKVFREQYIGINDFPPLLSNVFALIQSRILDDTKRLPIPEDFRQLGGVLFTTGTAIGIRTLPDTALKPAMEFAHAGDSSLYMFNHQSEQLHKVTRDEQVDNFLGSERHMLEQSGGFDLPSKATLALFSDGVGSDSSDTWQSGGGITETTLSDILADDTACHDKAWRILNSSQINDDASVIVVETHQ